MSVSPFVNDRIQSIACSANDNDARMSLQVIRNGRLLCFQDKLQVGSWNIEYFTPMKLVELQNIMIERGLHIMCLQENAYKWRGFLHL